VSALATSDIEHLNTLPLVRAEMLEVTIIPLEPYAGFSPRD
jgi:hypothetical protein